MAPFQKSTIIFLLLTACGKPLCVTTCGLKFEGATHYADIPAGWTCEDIQRQEDRAVEAFKSVDPAAGDFGNTCKYLSGHSVYLHDTGPTYTSPYSGQKGVTGETDCPTHTTLVANRPNVQGSAFTHELAHVVQGCEDADGELGHAGWDKYGIDAAVHLADHEAIGTQ